MEQYTPTPGESEAIRIMKAEISNWEEGAVTISEDKQLIMRNVVLKARRNYLGFFTEERNPITGRKKIFIPFTEWVVENMVKNIDIDTKDINVKARHGNEKDYLKAQFFRYIFKKKLDDICFGKTLNKLLRRLAIDGTSFLKLVDGKEVDVKITDRLNMVYDPSIEEIEESSGKTEKHVLTKPEFDKLKLNNSQYVKGNTTVSKLGATGSDKTTTEIPYVEVMERYGWFPKICLTDKEEDKDEYFYGHAIISGVSEKQPILHVIEEEDKDPYQSFKLKEVPNRADGRGIGEMLFNIQAYLNEVVNTRLDKGRIVGLGLFELKGNITPQQFKNLFTTGGIKTDNSSSINVLNTGVIDPSSYTDEERAFLWGTRVTGTTQDDEVAGNRPATNALIEQQGASKSYNLRIEDIMLDLGKFLTDKFIPAFKKELRKKKDDLIRITGDAQIFKKMDEILAENIVNQKTVEAYENTGYSLTEEEQQAYLQDTLNNLKELGNDRFMPIIDEILDTDFDSQIVITDENINRASIAQFLQNLIPTLAQVGLPIRGTLAELYDTLGLDAQMLTENMPEQAPMVNGQPAGMMVAGQEIAPLPQPSQVMPQ